MNIDFVKLVGEKLQQYKESSAYEDDILPPEIHHLISTASKTLSESSSLPGQKQTLQGALQRILEETNIALNLISKFQPIIH